MRRIGLAIVLTISLFAAPLAPKAQQPARLPRVGYLTFGTQASTAEGVEALRQGLREHGYIEGKTIVILPHSQDAKKRVEVFWTRPAGDGPYPVLLLIHGHQDHLRNGGEAFVQTGRLGVIATRGYIAAALSQPGYGKSDGPQDYCGPFTLDAAIVAVDFLRRQPFVDPKRVALYGYSRGAVVASMVATKDPRLAAVVLGAGAYDFFSWYPTPLPAIDANIRLETGASAEAFRARSAIHHVDKIRAPVLVLHGAQDERIPVRQAELFAEKLKASGVAVTLRIFPGARHGIPLDEQYREIYPFLEQAFR